MDTRSNNAVLITTVAFLILAFAFATRIVTPDEYPDNLAFQRILGIVVIASAALSMVCVFFSNRNKSDQIHTKKIAKAWRYLAIIITIAGCLLVLKHQLDKLKHTGSIAYYENHRLILKQKLSGDDAIIEYEGEQWSRDKASDHIFSLENQAYRTERGIRLDDVGTIVGFLLVAISIAPWAAFFWSRSRRSDQQKVGESGEE